MSLSVGLIGLPNVGKSTLFNAILKRQLAKVAVYPFTTIEPHEGTIDIPDERLTTLTLMVKPEKSTPATITFIDIAGLVRGAHKGEGLGNEFLGHIRQVDAILHVVRAFESTQALHPLGTVDPERDIEIINTELLLKDLDTVEKLIDKENDQEKKELLIKIKEAINSGTPVRNIQFTHEEEIVVKDYQFLTKKPLFFVLNISENELASAKVKKLESKDFLVICAKLEADLIELAPIERTEYLKATGISQTGLEKVLREAYSILDLITFFTIKGGKEVRAWPVKTGTLTLEAAGKVHTDFEKHFIRAEVISFSEFAKLGSWHNAKEQGKITTVGHDYIIKNGDVVEFKVGV
ncbi:redox-regulated ATPase YchF [Candidatus Gottesmanbacteria bacterium]|nr:redox-regulated ATPase YchF [Candidatus Gottesmanbacteria bacterium]MBI5452374.1 redox-regulated ATPase YchF [Candidatus Gottesmanbacteria bacterium]